MITVNREDRNGNVDIRVFVIDMIESTTSVVSLVRLIDPRLVTHPWKFSEASLNISSSQGFSP